MGRLLLKSRQIFFEYDAAFIKLGLELSPFKLPLKTNVIVSTDHASEFPTSIDCCASIIIVLKEALF